MLIDERSDLGIFIAFAIDDMAPVAPDRSHIQKDRLRFGAGLLKRFISPLVPVHRLMGGGTEIGACRILQAICEIVCHGMRLLDGILVARIARIDRFAPRETFILRVIETDAILAQLPAEINVLVVDARWEIEEPDIEVFHHAAG